MEGQLSTQERAFLRAAIMEKKPRIVLEVGTWKGGGSTWQIANALKTLGKGHLHTCEINPEFFAEARKVYTEEWSRWVTLHQQYSYDLIVGLIAEHKMPDFVFFDGPNNAEINMSDFKLLEPHLGPGDRFCAHDWDSKPRSDGLVAVKGRLLRPYLEASPDWKILGQLEPGKHDSVGMVLMERI